MLTIGLDIGSTTVKAVAVDEQASIVWKKYERHRTRQLEKAFELLREVREEMNAPRFNLFTTGSGGSALARILGVKQFQEVNALSEAVEYLHDKPSCVFELGGQDAKYILWRSSGRFVSMNDRCAGGTGATLDRIVMKLCLDKDTIDSISYHPDLIHPVAAKCGVFAETDINSLQKQGVGVQALMLSLFHAVVEQNLTVLARGHVPLPQVILLGGPNVFFPPLRQCWEARLSRMWEERGIDIGDYCGTGQAAAEPVLVPPDAVYYGALGAALLGRRKNTGRSILSDFGDPATLAADSGLEKREALPPLFSSNEERRDFMARFNHSRPDNSKLLPRDDKDGALEVLVGIDGGSTSTKGVALSPEGEVLASSYRISLGDPVKDVRHILRDLHSSLVQLNFAAESKAAAGDREITVLGVGYTGYAKDLLRMVFGGDTAVVETVAHTAGALHYVPDAEVICDVGGQDIKIIILRNGTVKDFRLNTQCSAGNGFYLQSTAERFGYPVHDYADAAFKAKRAPQFNFGCAVFLEADIVTFQQLGWQPEEIMAGLARVLPQNVWHYVVREPNLSRLGNVFVLQGGTHRNLAVVKAQVDFISGRVPDARIHLHPHGEIAGAIGAALEAGKRLREDGGKSDSMLPAKAGVSGGKHDSRRSEEIDSGFENSSFENVGSENSGSENAPPFVGFDGLDSVRHTVLRGEETRCSFCSNRCLRTIIQTSHSGRTYRSILATCERGQAQSAEEARRAGSRKKSRSAPNLVETGNRAYFSTGSAERNPGQVRETMREGRLKPLQGTKLGQSKEPVQGTKPTRTTRPLHGTVVGIPRVLNLYTTAPFFSTYFQELGARVIFSDFTSFSRFSATSGRGCIDPCFPSKASLSHVYQLLSENRATHIFFPCIRTLYPEVRADNHWSCAALAATPQSVKAALTMGTDEFAARGVTYMDPVLDMADPVLLERQLRTALKPLGIGHRLNRRAIHSGMRAWREAVANIRKRADQVLAGLEQTGGIGVILLGRPYHSDPGINHGIPQELSDLGYPVFSVESLPREGPLVERLFRPEIDRGTDPLDISDLWPRCFSENSSTKLWAARFTARHPNLIAVDISSFRCGHDAPIYSVLDELYARSGKPYFTFHEMDENRPASSIKLRIETIDYFLKQYRESRTTCPSSCLAV